MYRLPWRSANSAIRSHHSAARSKSSVAVHAPTMMQNVQAFAIGIVASSAKATAVASSRQRIPSSTRSFAANQGGALERKPQHLQVGNCESAPQLCGSSGQLGCCLCVAERVGEVALVECQPAVLRAGFERIQQAMRAA
jgi:hypothetical protein